MSSCMVLPHCLKLFVPELAAVARASAEVHLQHCVATVRQELGLGIEAPFIACPRTTVRIDHHREVLRFDAFRQGEVAVDGKSVSAGVADRVHLGHVVLIDPWSRGGQFFSLSAVAS